MAKYLINESTLTAIADAIRRKRDTTLKYTPQQFANQIDKIERGYPIEDILARDFAHVDIPDGVTKIGDGAFCTCSQLKEINFPDSVTTFGMYSFKGCNSLVNPTLPKNLLTISTYCFDNCHNLELTELPDSVTSIAQHAFSFCENLALAKLPQNLKFIGGSAFSNCTRLAIRIIPQSVETIEGQIFSNCPGIESITFKGKPTNMNRSVFYGCDTLTVINVPWAEGEVAYAPWGATNATINYNYTGE